MSFKPGSKVGYLLTYALEILLMAIEDAVHDSTGEKDSEIYTPKWKKCGKTKDDHLPPPPSQESPEFSKMQRGDHT